MLCCASPPCLTSSMPNQSAGPSLASTWLGVECTRGRQVGTSSNPILPAKGLRSAGKHPVVQEQPQHSGPPRAVLNPTFFLAGTTSPLLNPGTSAFPKPPLHAQHMNTMPLNCTYRWLKKSILHVFYYNIKPYSAPPDEGADVGGATLALYPGCVPPPPCCPSRSVLNQLQCSPCP